MGSEGTFCLVLHSHLPWLARHGAWPVGEDWLYQAWAHSYLPVVDVLDRLAERGHRDLLTLGVTPVLAAQLDHPYCLRAMHAWLADWQLRAHATHRRACPTSRSASTARPPRPWRPSSATGATGRRRCCARLADARRRGAARRARHAPVRPAAARPRAAVPARRRPARHRAAAGSPRPRGSGRPSAATRPGMEHDYAAAGVRRFLVDGPALRGDTAAAHPVDGTDVVAFGRDLEVTYRVWSPRAGYPGGPDYRDFHTFDHDSGFKPFRVTGRRVARQGALRPRARGGRRGARRRGLRAPSSSTRLAGSARAPRASRASSSPRTTPSSSATGGTRARRGWRRS